MSLIIKNIFDKNACVVNTDKKQRDLQNVIFVDKVIFEVNEDNLPEKDVLVVLDSGDIDRIGWISEVLQMNTMK
ncbi:hypothetical protein OGZ02_06975 [Brachyspira hyodysenteriae]|nr:hypothetical protein [Brachyspira hyodysenteriae]MDA1468586.1 hypothetical protein [Brachyspira hyodysenteriae]